MIIIRYFSGPPYEDRNNPSIRNHLIFIRKQLLKYLYRKKRQIFRIFLLSYYRSHYDPSSRTIHLSAFTNHSTVPKEPTTGSSLKTSLYLFRFYGLYRSLQLFPSCLQYIYCFLLNLFTLCKGSYSYPIIYLRININFIAQLIVAQSHSLTETGTDSPKLCHCVPIYSITTAQQQPQHLHR